VEQEHVDALCEGARTVGVHLEAELCDDCVWGARIERTGVRAGAGAAVLEELLDLADDAGVPVRAAVAAGSHRLLEWYRDLGFEIEAFPDDPDARDAHAVVVRHPEPVSLRPRRQRIQEA
jgi:GNAT superfamily N-acetyltransferase